MRGCDLERREGRRRDRDTMEKEDIKEEERKEGFLKNYCSSSPVSSDVSFSHITYSQWSERRSIGI